MVKWKPSHTDRHRATPSNIILCLMQTGSNVYKHRRLHQRTQGFGINSEQKNSPENAVFTLLNLSNYTICQNNTKHNECHQWTANNKRGYTYWNPVHPCPLPLSNYSTHEVIKYKKLKFSFRPQFHFVNYIFHISWELQAPGLRGESTHWNRMHRYPSVVPKYSTKKVIC